MTAYIQVFVYATLFLYLAGAGIYFLALKSKEWGRLAFLISIAGVITNSLALMMRTLLTGRLPLANGSEFLLCFAWFTVLFYLMYEMKSQNRAAGGIVLMIGFLLISAILVLMPGQLIENKPLMPALKSPWLTSHVLTAVFAYGGFALAAGLAAMQLRKTGTAKSDEGVYRIVAISFIMLTVTIVLGAIWAEQAWGRYWSWDPKEIWALITWIIYAIYLHLHRQRAWKGQKANMMVISGFIIVLFTYFGVNFLLSGLHSYN